MSGVLASILEGGVVLPVGLTIKDLLYADDISLLAETVEELNTMLQVCQAWANQNGFVFSVEKSKAMILVGTDPLELPSLTVYNEQLEWVKTFQYLGFTVYANNKPHKHLPLDLTSESVYQVLGPTASVLYPSSPAELPLVQRATAFCTAVEGQTTHSAQVEDLGTESTDKHKSTRA